jgi:very-short-patch-repair endonuclease
MAKKRKKKKITKAKQNKANQYADARRKNPTPAEKYFRKLLVATGIRFKSEKVVYKQKSFYIVDFYIPDKNLCIELDGGYHEDPKQKQKDFLRDKYLLGQGYQNWRMTNEEAMTLTVQQVKEKIESYPTKERVVRVIPMREERPYIPVPKHLKGNPRPKRNRKPSKRIKTKFPHLDQIAQNKARREGNKRA